MLIDRMWKGKMRKLMLQANRNGFFYVLDRETGEFLFGTPFARQTWAKGLDKKRATHPAAREGANLRRRGCLSESGRRHQLAIAVLRSRNRLVHFHLQRGRERLSSKRTRNLRRANHIGVAGSSRRATSNGAESKPLIRRRVRRSGITVFTAAAWVTDCWRLLEE